MLYGCWLVAELEECGACMGRDVWNASLSNFDKPGTRYSYRNGDKTLNALNFKAFIARGALLGKAPWNLGLAFVPVT
jgi:hypothetical protein